MNKYIKEQLLKCKEAVIPDFDELTTELVIKKSENAIPIDSGENLDTNSNYIIELENYIINPPETFTLASNWNQGRVPTSKYLYCNPKQIMGKMVKIDGIGYDISTNQYLSDKYIDLWLPRKGFKIIKKEQYGKS